MTPMQALYWAGTLIASIIIIGIFLSAHLDSMYRDRMKEANQNVALMREQLAPCQDMRVQLQQRYRLLRSKQMEGMDDDTN